MRVFLANISDDCDDDAVMVGATAIPLVCLPKRMVRNGTGNAQQNLREVMGKAKQVEHFADVSKMIVSAPKQSRMILAKYKPLPRMSGCTKCN